MILIIIIKNLFLLFTIMLFIRILGSWLPDLRGQRWMQFISFYTDPYLNFFRSFIPPLGMMDLSPIVAFLALGFIEKGILYLLSFLVL